MHRGLHLSLPFCVPAQLSPLRSRFSCRIRNRHKSAAQQITATAEPQSARLLQTSPDAGDVSGRMDKQESAAAVSHV